MVLLSVVVPTYNERENLPILLERLEKSLRGVEFEVIVVDDDSPDGTWRLALELARERYPWLRVVRRVGERGLASAVVRGFRESRGEYVVVMDADLQHPPEVVPRMLEAARSSGADLVVASRYVRGGGVRGWSRFRLLMSRWATVLAHLLVPESRCTSDPLSGFFLVSRGLISSCLDRLRPRGYKILLEVLVKCHPRRVVDVPYVFERRVYGRSKLGVGTIVDYLLHLLELQEYRVVKNALVGLTGVGVLLGVLHLLADVVGVPDKVAYAGAIEASIVNNYVLNDLLVFRGRRRVGFLRGLLEYHGAVGVGALLNYATYALLTALGLWKYYAAVGGVLAGFLANYLLSEHVVWRPIRRGSR